MKSFSRRSAMICLIAMLALPATTLAEEEDSGREEAKTVHIYDNVDLASKVDIQYAKPRIVVKAVYPQLESDDIEETATENRDEFNKLIHEFIDQQVEEFKKQVAENQKAPPVLPPKVKFKNDLYIDFASSFVRSGKHPIINIRFNVQGYIAGMAHPYHYHRVLNYDLADGKVLELDDLFSADSNYLPLIAAYCREALLHRHLSSRDFIDQGTAAGKVSNFKNWNLKANGILFTFDEYQVAPYVDGAQSVLVPYSALNDEIDKDSAIASCALHKRRCAQNNVVTGGFIDEAALRSRFIDPRHGTFNPILSKR